MILQLCVVLCCCFVISSGFNWGSFDWDAFFDPQDVDCWTTPWETGDCGLVSGQLRRELRRSVTREVGNGRKCSSYNTKKIISCDILDFMADVLRNNIMQQSPDGIAERDLPIGPGSRVKASEPLCSKDYKDSSGSRLLGRNCDDKSRKKRSIVRTKLRSRRQVSNIKKHRDVLFLIDESLSVTAKHFEKEVKLAKTIINSLCDSLNVALNQTRVAVNTFDFIVHEYLKFDKTFDKSDIAGVLDGIKFNVRTGWSTCMTKSLQHARNKTFTPEKGARVFNRDTTEGMIILITDGCANCASDAELKKMAEKLYERRITIIVLYIAPKTAAGERCAQKMKNLASGSHCYQVLRFFSWDEVVTFTDRFARSKCMNRWRFAPGTCV